jgi:hypothetical protein
MRALRFTYVCSCSLAVAAVMLVARAAAEPVQVSMTVDANTTALYRFREGTGATSANDVTGKPAFTVNKATWVPGRQYYALATDTGYAYAVDDASNHPRTAMTVEVWTKLNYATGEFICKNGIYFITLGDGTVSATFKVDSGSYSVTGVLPVPSKQWTHVAVTYQQTSATTATGAIYINGVLDAKTLFTGMTTGVMVNGYGSKFLIGNNDWSNMGAEVDGKFESVRISKIARVFDPLYPIPPASPTSNGNLVPNGDFEIGLTGWRGDDYGDVNLIWETTGGAATGQKCLHSISGAKPQAGLYSRPIPAHPGRHYTFSGRFKTSANSYNPRFEVIGVGVQNMTTAYQQYPTARTTWSQVTYSFTLPSNFSAPSLCVHIGYPNSLNGTLYVDDVRLMAGDVMNVLALKDKIAVGVQTWPIGSLYDYTPGATTSAALTIANTDTVAHNVTVQPTITDWEEKPVSGQSSLGPFNVPAGGAISTGYNMLTSRRGTFRLGFDLTSEGQTWHQSAEAKYAVVVNMQNVGNPDTSIFAMNAHMEREPTPHLNREMQVFSKCGVKWIRAWWGWGMCQKTAPAPPAPDVYDFTEYDRQYNAITTGGTGASIGIRVMPCMLRYVASETTAVGTFSEYAWAGVATSGTMQQPPYTSMMDEWGLFCGKVAQHFAGQIKAYELWNEPGMDDKGTVTVNVYTTLLNESRPNIRKAGNDPSANLVAFGGTALNSTPPAPSIQQILLKGTAGQMDAVSEHAYSQIMLPEKNYPVQIPAVRATMTAGGCPTNIPIWHTEQGIHADGDGYKGQWMSETDAAQLLTRNYVTAASQGSQRLFWFSADNPATYGFAVTFGDYGPRPRLAALAACASFIEGATFKKTCKPDSNTFAHLFQGTDTGVCVFWNTVTPIQLTLSMDPSKLRAFDTMGNAIPVVGTTTSTVQVAAERPTFLQCDIADYSALDTALSGAQSTNVCTVNIATTPLPGGVQVTLTGASSTPVDGTVELLPAASTAPKGWPLLQHFQSLAQGQSQSFTFVLPAKAAVGQVRIRTGDRRMIEVKVPYKAH